ncbi:MAG: hypothetical protein JWO89_2473 [Verrucomicrobiaceae bacterium]|nr:hypothetical protein [Verrucomicrobiaceae bacterium]
MLSQPVIETRHRYFVTWKQSATLSAAAQTGIQIAKLIEADAKFTGDLDGKVAGANSVHCHREG